MNSVRTSGVGYSGCLYVSGLKCSTLCIGVYYSDDTSMDAKEAVVRGFYHVNQISGVS